MKLLSSSGNSNSQPSSPLGSGNVKPDISVLIVNYNVKDYLLQCLRSLQAVLPGVTKEVIVVDNNSQDLSLIHISEPTRPY